MPWRSGCFLWPGTPFAATVNDNFTPRKYGGPAILDAPMRLLLLLSLYLGSTLANLVELAATRFEQAASASNRTVALNLVGEIVAIEAEVSGLQYPGQVFSFLLGRAYEQLMLRCRIVASHSLVRTVVEGFPEMVDVALLIKLATTQRLLGHETSALATLAEAISYEPPHGVATAPLPDRLAARAAGHLMRREYTEAFSLYREAHVLRRRFGGPGGDGGSNPNAKDSISTFKLEHDMAQWRHLAANGLLGGDETEAQLQDALGALSDARDVLATLPPEQAANLDPAGRAVASIDVLPHEIASRLAAVLNRPTYLPPDAADATWASKAALNPNQAFDELDRAYLRGEVRRRLRIG